MYSYDLDLPGNLTLRLRLPQPVFAEESARLLAAAYLPGVRFPPPLASADPAFTIRWQESPAKTIRARGAVIEVCDQWNGNASLLDLLNLTYGACRLRWLRQKLYPVHSACVGDERGYALLVGASGSGKTAIAMNLVRHHGARLFSGNKTLVTLVDGAPLAVAGTRTVTALAQDCAADAPRTAQVGYIGRRAFELESALYADVSRVSIRRIAFVRLNDGVSERSTLSSLSALHRLFPLFLDKMYEDTIVCGGEAVFSGNPPKNCREALVPALRSGLARTPVQVLSGSMSFIVNALQEDLSCPS